MRRVLIGIAGGTGSGKTTLARRLVDALPADSASLIQHDWYYRDRSHLDPRERIALNFDEPDALENDSLRADLLALKAGRDVDCPQYDFATHTRSREHVNVQARRVVIVEGVLLFAVPFLSDAFDLRLYIDAADDVRLMRRIKRDLRERARNIESIEAQYEGSVRPMHALHVAPSRFRAHLIVSGEEENAVTLSLIVGGIRAMLAT